MKKIFTVLFFTFTFSLITFLCPAQTIYTVAGNGINGFTGDGGPATAAEMSGTGGNVLFDNAGNIYFNDQSNSRIRKVTTAGIINTVAGNGVVGFFGDGGPATAAEFNQNTVITFDSARNMYVSDFGNNRIRKINTSGIVSTFAGSGAQGFNGNGMQATAAALNWPCCVIADSAGNIYIADSWNNMIRKVNTAGVIITFAGNGFSGYSGDGGLAQMAELNKPFRIAFDRHWNMYVADAFNSRIRKITPRGFISTFAGNGAAGFSGDGGPATAASINEAYGVCADTLGDIFIADSFNNRIRKVDTFGIITTYAGNGTGSYSGDGGPAIAAELNFPTGVGCHFCNLYIDDWYNHVMRMVSDSIKITASQNSICSGGSVNLIASGASTYKWSPPLGLSCTNCPNPTATPTVTTTYTVSSQCQSAETTITVSPKPNGTISGNVSICNGDSTSLNASGGTSYSWNTGATASDISVSPSSTATYSVIVNQNGCTDTLSTIVTVNPTPTVTLVANSPICAGDSAKITAGGGISYRWNTGDTTSSIAMKLLASTTYTLQVSNGQCIKDTGITITVNPIPNALITGKTSLCQGESTILNASGGGTYTWNTGATTGAIAITPSSNTSYSVMVANNGCKDSALVHISVNPIPNVSSCCDSVIAPGQFVQLSASGGSNYQWVPSVGLSCDTCANPTASPTQTTTYTVTITSDSGCITSQIITIDVSCGDVFVPTAFSPNNDGQNDILFVRGPCIKALAIIIFDRWGNKIFESDNISIGWDGNHNGLPMNTGTYVYSLEAAMYDGSTIIKKGNIALVR